MKLFLSILLLCVKELWAFIVCTFVAAIVFNLTESTEASLVIMIFGTIMMAAWMGAYDAEEDE